MTAPLSIGLAAFPLIVALSLFGANGDASAWGNVPLRSAFPKAELSNLKGESVKLVAAPAEVLVVIYVKPGQKRSKKALADLARLRTEFTAQQLKILAIFSKRHEGLNKAAALQKEMELPFEFLVDARDELWGKGGLFIFPTSGVIGAKGLLLYEYGGYRGDYLIGLRRQVKAALGIGPAPETIKEVDRHEKTDADLRDQRKARMKAMMAARELARFRQRLMASRALLNAGGVSTILRIYDKWIAAHPAPTAPLLAEAHAKLDDSSFSLEKLQQFAAQPGPEQSHALLLLGRIAAKRKDPASATTTFQRCLASSKPLAACGFELAKIQLRTAPDAAVRSCERAYQILSPAPAQDQP